jgi:hypothetical protein
MVVGGESRRGGSDEKILNNLGVKPFSSIEFHIGLADVVPEPFVERLVWGAGRGVSMKFFGWVSRISR